MTENREDELKSPFPDIGESNYPPARLFDTVQRAINEQPDAVRVWNSHEDILNLETSRPETNERGEPIGSTDVHIICVFENGRIVEEDMRISRNVSDGTGWRNTVTQYRWNHMMAGWVDLTDNGEHVQIWGNHAENSADASDILNILEAQPLNGVVRPPPSPDDPPRGATHLSTLFDTFKVKRFDEVPFTELPMLEYPDIGNYRAMPPSS